MVPVPLCFGDDEECLPMAHDDDDNVCMFSTVLTKLCLNLKVRMVWEANMWWWLFWRVQGRLYSLSNSTDKGAGFSRGGGF